MSTPDQPANLVPKLHEATTRANFELLMALARSLHELGLPSHRLEEVMLRIADRFNISLEVFSLPTGLFMTLNGTAAPPLTAVARVQTARCIWNGWPGCRRSRGGSFAANWDTNRRRPRSTR